MHRFFRLAGVAAALFVANCALGEEFVPYHYSMLEIGYVQKELGLTPEQKTTLTQVSKKAEEHAHDPPKNDPKDPDLVSPTHGVDWPTPDEMICTEANWTKHESKRVNAVKTEMEQVLNPKQMQQLQEMEFRQRAAFMLSLPQAEFYRLPIRKPPFLQIDWADVAPKIIGMTDDQKQKLRKIREEEESKIMAIQQESQAKAFDVLTPEQTKKLRALSERGGN